MWVSVVSCPFQADGYVQWGGAYVQKVGNGTWDTTRYGRQAGGMHPTGMLSCLKNVSCNLNRKH